jgi:hypothetical protein
MFVFQVIPVRIITTIATWIISGVWCHTSKRFRTFTTIITVVNTISIVLCVMSILKVYGKLKLLLAGKHMMFKLVTLKLIVGIIVLQRLVFSILQRTSVFKATDHMTIDDWEIGLLNFLINIEMAIFSFAFIPAYTWTPYTERSIGSTYRSSKWSYVQALLNCLNLFDIIAGCFEILKSRGGRSLPLQSYTQGDIRQPAVQQQQVPKYENERDEEEGYEYDSRRNRRHHRHDRRG